MKAYIAKGYSKSYTIYQHGSNNVEINTNNSLNGGSNYATNSPQEMFAECYTLCMLGHCQSMETIKEHFPRTFECAKEILKQTRELSVDQRHKVD